MENLSTVLNMFRKRCYIASIDLTDAYYTDTAVCMDEKYFLLQLEGNIYKYTCLSNGLMSRPKTFAKILKPMFLALRKQGH